MNLDIESIFLIEWKEDDKFENPSFKEPSVLGTHLYQNKELTDKHCYCKHCQRIFEYGDEKAVKLHMRAIHPQIGTQMTFGQYVDKFQPKYEPNAHGSEVAMEKSFSIALRKYVLCPERFPEVLRYDNTATIMNDKFPKAEFHLLILPRAHYISRDDPKKMDAIKPKLEWHIEWCKEHVWKMFEKKYSFKREMTKDQFLNEFIEVGVHYVPSMANAHIHVITKDFHNDCLKNKKHFNSFNGPFFVKWIDLPVQKQLSETTVIREFIKNKDLICPYCSYNFGNRFTKLKSHLDEEFNKRFAAIST